ncbi:hypothetical protein PINS_up003303 [Pythium insidiosum]|nr:hypothetical protein PINS_up003303 [Pythium insidiosum]
MSRVHHDQRYRAKLKARELSLATHVPRLRTDIRHLRLLRDLARRLRRSHGVAPHAHTQIIRSVAAVLDQDATTRDSPAQGSQPASARKNTASINSATSRPRASNDRSPRSNAATPTRASSIADTGRLRRHVDSLVVSGAPSAPIVTLCGSLRGRLDSSTIRQLYQCTPGNSALMHALVGRDVVFSSRRTLFFSSDGELEHDVIDTDYASGLVPFVYSSLAGLSEMVKLLSQKEKCK